MVKEELIKIIESKISEISNPYELGKNELYLEDFFENNSYIGDKFLEMDIKKGMTCLYYGLFQKDNIDECEETINSLYEMTDLFATNDLKRIINLIFYFIDKYDLDSFIEVFTSKNTIKNYQILLNDLNINYDSFDVEKIMHNSLDDIREIVNILNKFELNNNDKLNVLANSDLDTLRRISEYILKGFIPKQEVIANVSILFTNDSKFDFYLENVKVLNNYNINPYLFKNSLTIMFNGDNLLKDSLEVLNSYGLVESIKTTGDFSFFYGDYVSKIDKLIELGYYEVLKCNLGLLNYSTINRLEMLKVLGEEVKSMDEIVSILESDSFFVPDSLIDSYLPDEVRLHEDVLVDLDTLNKFKEDSVSYNINGVVVSSNKVNRELENGASLYKAITKNLRLSDEGYESLVNGLGNSEKVM